MTIKQKYLKRRIKALKVIRSRTAITTKQVATKITDHTFIIVLDNRKAHTKCHKKFVNAYKSVNMHNW